MLDEDRGLRRSLDRQLPIGVADLFFQEAAAKTALENTLGRTFQRWGYSRIIPPTFEYYESLSTGASPQLRHDMYRFFDREGRILALRPDMTVPTARIVGTKLFDQQLPLRFYYVGQVFRHEEPQAGRWREFTQAGIELIGAGSPEADAEVVTVAIDALRDMGIKDFQINLGQVTFLQAVLKNVDLANGELRLLERTIDRKNDIELQRLVAELGLEGDVGQAVLALPHLSGDKSVLREAERLAPDIAARRAIERLERVYDILCTEKVVDHVILDLGEVRKMDYYTGVSFIGYVQGLGFPICSGGRYDRLISEFGADLPAVGFALGVERSLLVAQPQVRINPDLVIQSCDHPTCRLLARLARRRGLCVEIDVMDRRGQELIAYARARGATYAVCCQDGDQYLMADAHTTREVGLVQLKEEIRSWNL